MPTQSPRIRIALSLLALLFAAGCASTAAPEKAQTTVDAAQLIGNWQVDLRPLPSAPGYYQSLLVTAVRDKTFSGTFYGAPIEQARINTDWGAVRIAFVTSDQSGAYHHSAVLMPNGRLEGSSNSTGRDFLSYWSASKP